MENSITTRDITEKNATETIVEVESESTKVEKFKPDVHFWLAFSPLTVLVVMVALDGTSLSVALPVSSHQSAYKEYFYLHGLMKSDHFPQLTRYCHRGILDRNQLPPQFHRIPATDRCPIRHLWP
jgi:hypothetical protein